MIRYLKTKCTARPLGAEGRVVLEAGAEVFDLVYEANRREWHLYAVGPEGLENFVARRKPRLKDLGER
jgi:hypothetical protein